MSFEFFVVKSRESEPFYNAIDDICFANIQQAWIQSVYLAERNKNKISDYYIVRLEATSDEEIVRCFWAAANGQGAKIQSYKILNIISIENG